MKFVSTRNSQSVVSFVDAILHCMPSDGGLYVPVSEHDLRSWILHLHERSSFSSIAGTLTSALLKDEISPVISERIAATAFEKYSPRLRQLDDALFLLELFHGPTGNHRDFGFLWLASALEHILIMEGKKAIVIAPSTGNGGRSMAAAFGNKKHLKLVILYPKGHVCGLSPEVLYQNGGSVYPIEIEGSITDAENSIRAVYSDTEFVKRYHLTLANTINIGRILPQVFFYMYAFTSIRKRTSGEIFYAVPSGNYGNLAAGLYAWKFCLPLQGFITDATDELTCSENGECMCMSCAIPLQTRSAADPAAPSSIERLEQIFSIYPNLMKELVFPARVTDINAAALIAKSYKRYGIMFDTATARAYSAALAQTNFHRKSDRSLVIVSKDHPALESNTLRDICGEPPIMPESLHGIHDKVKGVPTLKGTKEELQIILEQISMESL